MTHEEEIQRVAKQAAREAMKETFTVLGVNLDDFNEVRYFRKDLVWLRKYRRMSEATGSRMMITFVTIVTGGFVYALWDAIRNSLK